MKTFFGLLGFAIALLALVVFAAFCPHVHPPQEPTVTSVRISLVASGLMQLSTRAALGQYPPSSVAKLRDLSQNPIGVTLGEENELNRGIESAWVALHLQGVTTPLNLPDEAFANTDGDTFARNVTSTESVERREIVDAWGNPLAYFHHADYAKPDAFRKIQMVLPDGQPGEVAEVRPWRRPKTGTFINARSFQLFSAGEDGVFNTEDDIGNWERSPE